MRRPAKPSALSRRCALTLGALLAFAASSLPGEDSLAERINARAQAYEQQLEPSYRAVSPGLEGWLADQRRQVLDRLHGLMAQCSGEQQLFVAFHCLEVDPADGPARQAFADAKVDPPMDEQGKAAATFSLSAPVPAELAQQVAESEHPSFDRVAQAVDLKSGLVSRFWNDQLQANKSLLHDLLGLTKQGQDPLIFQLLAFYYPVANEVVAHYREQGRRVPTERWWVDPVDQFLIDHELMGWDCLTYPPRIGGHAHKRPDGAWSVPTSTWAFPSLRSCRVEMVAVPEHGVLPAMLLGDDEHGGVKVTFNLAKKSVQMMSLATRKIIGTGTPLADLSKPLPIEIEIRDRHASLSVGGLPLIAGDLAHACVLSRFTLGGDGMAARSLCLRFINSNMPGVVVQVVKPAEWPDERRQQLEKRVSVSFSETPVEEVVALLSRLAGVKITLDDSGQLLKDLPVTLDAKDMKLASVLENLQRQTDLRAQPTAEGIALSWSK